MSHRIVESQEIPEEHHVYRVGDWHPEDHRVHKEWFANVIEHVDKHPKEFDPTIQKLQRLIETNARIRMLVVSMFDEVPVKKRYARDPTGGKQIRDYKHMLELLNHLLTTAPYWNDQSQRAGMVGLPIQAVLDWPMGTPSGFTVFQDPEFNAVLKDILLAWGRFLKSRGSAEQVLHANANGWLGASGKQHLEAVANMATGGGCSHSFEDQFICDPTKEFHGYGCWDDFFTRQFREGVRAVASPDDDAIITAACESKPYNLARSASLSARFWNKGQPYSIRDMLGHDALAEHFAGATVFQAFLSALSYHRWHAPVSGKVVKAYVIPGTYYSEPLWEGLGDPNKTTTSIDEKSEGTCQGYLAHMAARAVVFIEADSPKIGLMAFVGIGMDEVSTCDMRVEEGQHVKKGDELGMFHFGGSTHCLLFREGVKVEGFPEAGREANVPVRSKLAVIKSD